MSGNYYGPGYGAAVPGYYTQQPYGGASFVHGKRRTSNFGALCTGLAVPWFLFVVVSWTLTFSVHYLQSELCAAIVFACLLFVLLLAFSAFTAWKQRAQSSPNWAVFLFVTSLLAWLLAYAYGAANYKRNMEPFYDVSFLNSYPSIDPALYKGAQLMDMGRVAFTTGSHLDLTKSIGFRNSDVYCVAPIVTGNTSAQMPVYDFWAVGLNCCTGHMPDFACGEYNNPMAHSGLRLMRDDLRPFYRLAVQQAEATYNIKAQHPVFMYWMQDPNAELSAYQDEGNKQFLLGVFGFLALQLTFVVSATILFSKMS